MFIGSPRNQQLESLTDQDLIQAFCKTRQEHYFNELFQRYTHLVYGVCLRFLEDAELSKDVAMMVFTQAFQVLPKHDVRNFRSWLFIIVRNQCFDQLRKHRSESIALENWQELQESADDFMENDPSNRLYAEHEAEASQLVDAAIAQLNDEQKVCIQLFFFQRKSYKEIASLTQFSEKQVKSYLQNGKRQLRLKLSDFF